MSPSSMYILAIFHTILIPLVYSTSTYMPIQPTPQPSICPVTTRESCRMLYSSNVSLFTDSTFSNIFREFCDLSQPASSQLCSYTENLVACVTNRISALIMSGVNSRVLDSSARNILLYCAGGNTSTLPTDQNIVSNFASTVNAISFYGYFINQGLFSNLTILQNFTTSLLREINSLCISNSANTSDDYISALNVSNLAEISCTTFCPVCPTRLISSSGDNVIPVQVLCSTISNTSLVSNCLCGDSRISLGEECDDGNRGNSDGCDYTCAVENEWTCTDNTNGVSECSNCGNDIREEFREECDHNFGGCDSTLCTVLPLYNCAVFDTVFGVTNCSAVDLDTNTSNPFSVDSEYRTSQTIFRLNMDFVNVREIDFTVNYRLIFSRLDNPDIESDSNPVTINIERLATNLGLASLTIEPNFTVTANSSVFMTTYTITESFLRANNKDTTDFRSCLLAFINATQIDLSNRPIGSRVRVEIQIEEESAPSDPGRPLFGSANINITTLGIDDSVPVIALGNYTPIFYEGNTSIPIVSPLSTVVDSNDLFYPIQSLRIIFAFIGASDFPFESINATFLPNKFNLAYDTRLNELTISGPGLGNEYTEILRNIVYVNTKPEPTSALKRFSISARDTVDSSASSQQILTVQNVNDPPILTLSRGQIVFNENDSPVILDGSLTITDEDTNPSILSAYIQLVAFDNDEVITGQNIIAVSDTFLLINSSQSIESVRDIFRTVTYQHLSDNPTSGTRVITFSLIDNNNAEIFTPFSVTVQPANDLPVVLLTRDFFTFTEDLPAILLGDAITLTDVDSSNLTQVELVVSNIPLENRLENVLLFAGNPNVTLASIPQTIGVIFTHTYYIMNNRPIRDFQISISSLQFNNTFVGDFANIEGNRTIQITATDLEGARSQPVRITVEIKARNDAPILNLGSGFGQNWTFSFTEHNSSSQNDPSNEEHIVLLPVVDIIDEENHNIFKLTIQLEVSNGQLDANEFIFVRSPLFELFDNSTLNIQWYTLGTFMEFTGNASALNYTNILKSVYYTNDENEPTLFPFGGRFLKFEITDIFGGESVSYTVIVTIPINDNKPVLLLRLHPGLESVLARLTREIATFKTLNATAFIEKEFNSELDTLTSGDVVRIVFDTAMKTRNLAHQYQINSLLHFNMDVHNELPKFSYWKDSKTLAIIFPRIDEKFRDKLTPLQSSNLSIIFKDCALSEKKCINLCANKKQLTCAKGEISVKIIATQKMTSKQIENAIFAYSLWHFAYFIMFILMIAAVLNLLIRFCFNSGDKKRNPTKLAEKIPNKNGYAKDRPRKTDEEQINSFKNRKYNSRKAKINPRSTPNIFKHVISEN